MLFLNYADEFYYFVSEVSNLERAMLNEILDSFNIKGTPVSCERYGSGHINDTNLLVMDDGVKKVKYILQRINKRVFRDPPSLMNNFGAVTEYLKNIFRTQNDNIYNYKKYF